MRELSVYRYNKFKYFPKYYVGLKEIVDVDIDPDTRERKIIDSYHLGFMTPFEDNKSGEKRRITVDNWARPQTVYDYVTKTSKQGKKIQPKVVDNFPGYFQIKDLVRRRITNNALWRVVDPNYFDVEITSENLLMILMEVGIKENGFIPNKCVWMRVGSLNHLIPQNTKIWAKWVQPELDNIIERYDHGMA